VKLDVFASSEAGQTLTASVAGLPDSPLAGNGGSYYTRIDSGTVVPASVTVTNTSDAPLSTATGNVTDAVAVSQADYDLGTQTLTVAAASSDAAAAPALVVSGADLADSAPGAITGVVAPPATVTVASALGGSTSRDVTGVG
jgi:hypothetical protein